MRKPKLVRVIFPIVTTIAGLGAQANIPAKGQDLQNSAVHNTVLVSQSDKLKAKRAKIIKISRAIIVEKLGVQPAEVTMKASFTNDLGADSLNTVELIMEFEKEFKITILDKDAEKLATFGKLIDYLEIRLKHQKV